MKIEPSEFELGAGQSRMVTVSVNPPDGFAGRQAINVNAVNQAGRLVGGVTLYTTG